MVISSFTKYYQLSINKSTMGTIVYLWIIFANINMNKFSNSTFSYKDLKFSLEGQKQRNIQLSQLLEQQKQQLNESQQKIESQRALHEAQLAEERGRNLELQVLLESEKVRIREMSSTLDRERELHADRKSVV